MKKKHVHRWVVDKRGVQINAVCEGCNEMLSWDGIHRRLDAWERRPKYRKATAIDLEVRDKFGRPQPIANVQFSNLYVKVSR